MASLQSIRVELSQRGKEFLPLAHKRKCRARSRVIVSETGSEKDTHTPTILEEESRAVDQHEHSELWGRLVVSLHLIHYLRPRSAPIQAKSKDKDRFIGGSSPLSSLTTQVGVSEVAIEGETERKEKRKRKHKHTDRQQEPKCLDYVVRNQEVRGSLAPGFAGETC